MGSRIEDVYNDLRGAGGQTAQLARGVDLEEVTVGFRNTVAAIGTLPGSGRFYPDRDTTLRDLAERRGDPSRRPIHDGDDLAAWLGLPRWRVTDDPRLDFHYVDRELVVTRVEVDGKPQYASEFRLEPDLLLVNASVGDRTPIVAEAKIGKDENALLALVQALAAAAQLTPESQRRRLPDVYSEHFGEHVADRLDIYVLMHEPPTTGIRPDLLKEAIRLAGALRADAKLGTWIRRIAFLTTRLDNGALVFTVGDRLFDFDVA